MVVCVAAALPRTCVEVKARVAVFGIRRQVQQVAVGVDGARHAVGIIAERLAANDAGCQFVSYTS